MSNLAAAGAAHRSHFSRREWREVVMEHERLGRLARIVDAVEPLDVVCGTERDSDERLRLTASEQGRAVHAGQHLPVTGDMTDFLGHTSSDALIRVEGLGVERVVLDSANKKGADLGFVGK